MADEHWTTKLTCLTETILEDGAWGAAGLAALSERAVVQTLAHLGMGNTGYLICVLGCNDTKITSLNSDFRGKAKATNVLSWPSEDRTPGVFPDPGEVDDPRELGDIAIAFETCAAEANAQNKAFDDHVTHLIVHATLHLLGYDHQEDNDATLMEAKETTILAGMGIADPYI